MRTLYLAATILLALCSSPAGAQKSAIAGQVTDSSGAVIPNAKILVQWDSTSWQVEPTAGIAHDLRVTTNDLGLYEAQVPAGFYDIFVSSAGFTPRAAKVRVREGQRATFNTSLAYDRLVARELGDEFSGGDVVEQIPVDSEMQAVCAEHTRPDCPNAVEFFEALQKAVTTNDHSAVASMVRFPLRVTIEGKKALIKNRSQLLRDYDTVFDKSVRCAIARASRTEVWGNWRGFTVGGGVAWWERSAAAKSPFKLITVNNGASYEGSGDGQ